MGIKVIGSGLGRTGTSSLKLALEQLGFGKCYHMVELLKAPHQLKYFEQAEQNGKVDWDTLFTGCQSAIDYPVARYYKQLMKMYPEAKVIHTMRDPESWYNSCVDTIFWASKPDAGRIVNMMIRMPFNKGIRERLPVLKFNGKLLGWEFGKDLKNKEAVIAAYKKHSEEVLNTVPKERLLVYEVKNGWEPLCSFLNVPLPTNPFPRANTKEEFIENVKKISKGASMVEMNSF